MMMLFFKNSFLYMVNRIDAHTLSLSMAAIAMQSYINLFN